MTLEGQIAMLRGNVQFFRERLYRLEKQLAKLEYRRDKHQAITTHLRKYDPKYREASLAQMLGRPARRRRWYPPAEAVRCDP